MTEGEEFAIDRRTTKHRQANNGRPLLTINDPQLILGPEKLGTASQLPGQKQSG